MSSGWSHSWYMSSGGSHNGCVVGVWSRNCSYISMNMGIPGIATIVVPT